MELKRPRCVAETDHMIRSALILLGVQLLLACSSKQALCLGFGRAFPKPCHFGQEDGDTDESPPPSGGEEAAKVDDKFDEAAPDLALVRLTPEQLSKTLRQAVNFGEELDFDDAVAGQRVDQLLTQFGLGRG